MVYVDVVLVPPFSLLLFLFPTFCSFYLNIFIWVDATENQVQLQTIITILKETDNGNGKGATNRQRYTFILHLLFLSPPTGIITLPIVLKIGEIYSHLFLIINLRSALHFLFTSFIAASLVVSLFSFWFSTYKFFGWTYLILIFGLIPYLIYHTGWVWGTFWSLSFAQDPTSNLHLTAVSLFPRLISSEI